MKPRCFTEVLFRSIFDLLWCAAASATVWIENTSYVVQIPLEDLGNMKQIQYNQTCRR